MNPKVAAGRKTGLHFRVAPQPQLLDLDDISLVYNTKTGPLAALVNLHFGVAEGRPSPTINYSLTDLRAAVHTGLNSVGIVRRAGKSVGVVDVDVFDDNGNLVAVGRATYSTLSPTSPKP